MIRHLMNGLRMAFLCAMTASLRADDSGDVGFVAKEDKLPNGIVRADVDLIRITPLLAGLQDGHRLRVEFTTISKGITNYKDDIRYVRMVTPLNAAGKPDGQEIEYADWYRKAVRTTDYRDGLKHGLDRTYDVENGAVTSESSWEKGDLHGVKRVFHLNGKLASESTFERGLPVGQSRSYNENGVLIRVVAFTKGKRNGDLIDYWPDKPDAPQRIVPYKQDQVDGVARGFYLSGKVKWERPFRNNRQHGVEKQVAADGTVEKTIFWLDGNPVSQDEYQAREKK